MAEKQQTIFSPTSDKPPESPEAGKDYYEEYKAMFVKNQILLKHHYDIEQELNTQREKQSRLQARQEECGKNKLKRHRRLAKEIERHFICPHCNKRYGSEGSLNQHVKLKHNESNG